MKLIDAIAGPILARYEKILSRYGYHVPPKPEEVKPLGYHKIYCRKLGGYGKCNCGAGDDVSLDSDK